MSKTYESEGKCRNMSEELPKKRPGSPLLGPPTLRPSVSNGLPVVLGSPLVLTSPSEAPSEFPLALQHEIANCYLSALSQQFYFDLYKQRRAEYRRELLNQMIVRMAACIPLAAPLLNWDKCTQRFLVRLAKKLLMTEFEVAVWAYYLRKTGEDGRRNELKWLSATCGFHAKATLSGDISHIHAYLEAKLPKEFSYDRYTQWVTSHREKIRLDGNHLNEVYKKLSESQIPASLPEKASLMDINTICGPIARKRETKSIETQFPEPLVLAQDTSMLERAMAGEQIPTDRLPSLVPLRSNSGTLSYEPEVDLIRQDSFPGR